MKTTISKNRNEFKKGQWMWLFMLIILLWNSQAYAESAQAIPVQKNMPASANVTYDDPFFTADDDMTGWNPWAEMSRMQQQMEKLFQQRSSRSGFGATAFEPELEVQNQEKEYVIKIDLPGMDKNKLNVSVTDQYMTISGERRYENSEQKNGNIQWTERSYGSFSRTLPVPENAKTDDMKAEYKDGVLVITLPKIHPDTPEKNNVRNIKIQ